MGRPLNSKNFGDTAGGGTQLQVTADIGAGNEACWVMAQNGSKTYTVAAEADSNRTGRVILQAATPAAEGEAQMAVYPYDGVANTTATATATTDGDAVNGFTITDGGSGYSVAPTVTVTGGGGAGADITAELTAGVVTNLVINSGGTGYTTPPTLTFSAPEVGGVAQYAKSLLTHVVKTFEGNTYKWRLGVEAAAADEANIQSA